MTTKCDTAISLRLPKSWLKQLKRKSFERSLSENREIKYSELIRNAIAKEFDLPSTDSNQPDGSNCHE